MAVISPDRWRARPKPARNVAPMLSPSTVTGVTVCTPGYSELTGEAVARFQQMTGLDVVVIHSPEEPGFAAKLNLDLYVIPGPIVFFDVDYWMLRPFDFVPAATGGKFCAVPDPGVNGPTQFPAKDCAREGWKPETYFNSGLFACDLSRTEIREVFAAARRSLAECHAGTIDAPADWTDQYFLNWALQQQPGLFHPLPLALNFYMVAVHGGNVASIPAEIIGLHAAGIKLHGKLETLRQQATVFGPPQPSK